MFFAQGDWWTYVDATLKWKTHAAPNALNSWLLKMSSIPLFQNLFFKRWLLRLQLLCSSCQGPQKYIYIYIYSITWIWWDLLWFKHFHSFLHVSTVCQRAASGIMYHWIGMLGKVSNNQGLDMMLQHTALCAKRVGTLGNQCFKLVVD